MTTTPGTSVIAPVDVQSSDPKGTETRLGTLPVTRKTVYDAHMRGTFAQPLRIGLTQALAYECTNLAAVGSTNVWKHFQKRVLAYASTAFALYPPLAALRRLEPQSPPSGRLSRGVGPVPVQGC